MADGYISSIKLPNNKEYLLKDSEKTDEKVNQVSNTEDKEFPIILKYNNNTTNETNGVKYNGDVTVNPSKSKITATTIQANSRLIASKAISQIITGTGTAGSYTNSTYHPAKWTFNTGLTATNGDIFTIKIPVAGHDYGVFMSIDNGANYYPVVLNGTGRVTTHYPVNTYLTVIFEPTGSATSMFALNGQTSSTRITVTGGVWRVLNYYDSGNSGLYQNYNTKSYKVGSTAITAYDLIAEDINGYLVPAHKIAHRVGSPIFIRDGALAANATGSWASLYDRHYSLTIRKDGNNLSLTTYAPVFLKGTISAGIFTPDTTTPFISTKANCNVSGAYYMYIGDATGGTTVSFNNIHPYYYYNGTNLLLYTEQSGDAATVNGLTVKTAVPANAVFTDHYAWGDITSKPDTATRWPKWNEISQSGAENINEGSSDVTDNTEILTSYASNNGFADTNGKGIVYRRDAIKVYNYIKGKLDSVYATQTTVNGLLAAADAMVFKGTIGTGGTVTALPATHNAGWTYRVITAGTWAGKYCEVGTLIICTTDGTTANDAHWTSVETNEDGAVIGPSSSTGNNIVTFNGNTGRIIQDSAKAFSTATPSSSSTDAQIPTAKAVWAAIDALDGNLNSTTPGAGKTLTAFSQTNGKVSATFGNISITKSQISDFAHNHDDTYLKLSGGTLTGALTTANNTWNKIGDDAQLGDINEAGTLGIQGLNGNTGIRFTTYNQTAKQTGGKITWDGTKFSITSTTAIDGTIANATSATALTSNAGGTEQPIYFTGGKPTATSYALKATVNNGTTGRLSYYSGDRAISATTNVHVLNNYQISNSRNDTSVDIRANGLIIWGQTYGNTANQMLSNTAGVFRFGDGGPQIVFNTTNSWNAQAGALIFTDHDTAGTGTSFHFVSTESSNNNGGSCTVTAPHFRARTGLTVGQNSDNTSYNLYVNGTSYLNGAVTINGNLIFPTANILDWNSDTYRQRITITDDSTADTAVFTFQQSTNNGSSYTDLFTIKDNGTVLAKTFHSSEGATTLSNNNLTFAQGGGWYMNDPTWIRTVGSKSVYMNTGTFRNDGTTQLRSLSHVNANIVADGTWTTGATGTAGDGTNAGTLGTSILTIGNATAQTTTSGSGKDNSKGYLRIYGAGTGYGELTYNDSMFASTKSIYLATSANSGINNEVRGIMAANDFWRVAGGATASNVGYMEIATADDGNEPIYVRQYTGVFTTLTRTLTLLDASGNSSFPGNITVTGASTFTGNVTVGNTNSGALGLAQTDGLGLGISLYGGPKAKGALEYGIMFGKTATFGTHGSVTGDWATYFTMNRNDARGWIFKSNGGAANANNNVASIAGNGNMSTIGNITIGSHVTLQYNTTDLSLDFIFI